MPMRRIPSHPGRQRGAALYVALVFLVLLALLGVTGMQVAALQERMAANYRAANLAFQNSESVARSWEQQIIDSPFGSAAIEQQQRRCETAFDVRDWVESKANGPSDVSISKIDPCTPGWSEAVGKRPDSEEPLSLYQITAYATDDDDNPTSEAAIDTIFIP